MPATTRQRLYRGHRRIYAFLCPGCGFQHAADHIEHYANAIRARRNRRYGRYVSVRQLRMFIEAARSQIDWDSSWVSMDDLYRIIEHISQMDNEDSMDVDNAPLVIHDVLDQLENL
ncbi:hypothetical protein FRC10_011593, partial [Ceratobasidium sp. 414]